MKRNLFTFILTASALLAFAQSPETNVPVQGSEEENNQVVTIEDILDLQERVTSQQSTSSHFEKAWGNKSYFNISYLTSATLKPTEDIVLGYEGINNNKVPDFKADYGFAIQLGHNYNLLKKPIANIVNINLDYTYIDLSMAHYKKEPGQYVYDSKNTWEQKDGSSIKNMQYVPWGLGKYDISYGMNLGPSVTVLPFTHLNIQDLHFLKINIYYHIGYQLGMLWMPNNIDANASRQSLSANYNDPLKLNWQHGLTQSIGFNLSWKFIGLGFESKFDNRTYKSCNTSEYGNNKYKFKGNSSRIYIRICY